jgi:hypothetical protein
MFSNKKPRNRLQREHRDKSGTVVLSSSGSVIRDLHNTASLLKLSAQARPKTWKSIALCVLGAGVHIATGDIVAAVSVLTKAIVGL